MPESWSLSPTFKRLLLTIAAVPAGVLFGFVVAIPVVGAPHAFPGLLMHAPEPVRNTVGMAIVYGMPVLFVYIVWHGVIWGAISGRGEPQPEPRIDPVSAGTQASVMARFREKSSDELKAILATKAQALYPDRTYQLVDAVLKERGVV